MAMVEFIQPILEIAKCIGKPIWKYWKSCRNLDKNVKILERKLEELNSQKQDIESTLDKESYSFKIPTIDVDNWLKDVKRINSEIEISRYEKKANEGRCFSRASLGIQVEKEIQKVGGLHEKCPPFNRWVVDGPKKGVTLPTTELVGESAAEKTLNEIWNYLMDDEVKNIGVYGMGGVGKTIIMKHVHNKLLKKPDKFDKVIWFTVSQDSQHLDIAKLQNHIAAAFKGDFSKEEDEATRAGNVLRMLKKKRYVLILDGLRKGFCLGDMGILQLTRDSGCKLVITTRSIEVCDSMDCNKVVHVKPLSKKEALDLFFHKVGREVLDKYPAEKETINLIVEECGGLPLAIVTIGDNMKGVKDVREWQNALSELREQIKSVKDMEIQVFGRLKLSYDDLQEEIQYCFLYCTLYPKGFEIPREELIQYWIDEGFIEEMRTRLDMYRKGHAILNSLENKCLLERVEGGKHVKMHHFVRAMALRIANVSRRFMIKSGMKLLELPPGDEWRDVEKVFLIRNSIIEIPPDLLPATPSVSTLLLQQNPLKTIHESFFAKMVKLKILDLSNTHIEDLSTSIFDLKTLTALLLQGCRRLTRVPDLISQLQALKKLVLRDTAITEVPQGTTNLKNLRYLDLRTDTLIKVPDRILKELSRLQHLTFNMTSATNTVFMNGEEVAQLKQLETFEGNLYDVDQLNMYVKSIPAQEGPSQYCLEVGPRFTSVPWNVLYRKYVGLNEFSICGDSLMLPRDIQDFSIKYCPDVRSLSDISSLKDVNGLKCCRIRGCEGIECLFSYCATPLQSLEELTLFDLDNLRVLIKRGEAAAVSTTPPGTFSQLRKFYVFGCPKIKMLFWPELLRDLQNLEEIDVSDCKEMKEIVGDDEESQKEEGTNAIRTFTLPKFRKLTLWDLPELKSICSRRGVMACDSLQQIDVRRCPKLKSMPFSLPLLRNGQPSSLKQI